MYLSTFNLNFPSSGKLPCYEESDYSYVLNILSNFLLVVNAAVVAIIYGFMDVVYRTEFVAGVKLHFHYMLCLGCWQKTNSERTEQNVFRMNLRRQITIEVSGEANLY